MLGEKVESNTQISGPTFVPKARETGLSSILWLICLQKRCRVCRMRPVERSTSLDQQLSSDQGKNPRLEAHSIASGGNTTNATVIHAKRFHVGPTLIWIKR